MQLPETLYVRTSDGVHLAYQVVGEGPVDIVCSLNSDEGNVDLIWEEPEWRTFLEGFASIGRLVIYDRRGVGVSSRNVPPPTLEVRVADLVSVLDAAGVDRAVFVAAHEPGAMHAMFAATHPDRVSALVWNNPIARFAWAPDYPWGFGPAEFAQSQREVAAWGTLEWARGVADWREAERRGIPLADLGVVDHDPAHLHAYARINRNTASPDVAAAIEQINWETDIRGVLGSVHAPAVLVTGENDKVDEARYVASLMPNATVRVVPGRSAGDAEGFVDIVREAAGVTRRMPDSDTVLATVLFTDIVDSTARQAALGDRGWKGLVERHHAVVREALAAWGGTEVDTAGDGFYATFEGPARGIRCALDIVERVRALGIDIRAGLHTGECERIDGKVGGLAVAIGARVSSLGGAADVLVSQTVKDLVAGSGLAFEDAGDHELKGVPDHWHLYRVVA